MSESGFDDRQVDCHYYRFFFECTRRDKAELERMRRLRADGKQGQLEFVGWD
jgi:hypothetical protein